jgi:hypothetical protein
MVLQAFPRLIPQGEVLIQGHIGIAFAVRHGQTAAGADRNNRPADGASRLFQGAADLGQMCQIGSRADVHVDTGHAQAVPVRLQQAVRQLLVPDAMFGLRSPGIGLLAVTMPETRIDPQRDISARRNLPQLIDHIGRAAIDVQIVLQTNSNDA